MKTQKVLANVMLALATTGCFGYLASGRFIEVMMSAMMIGISVLLIKEKDEVRDRK